MLFRPFAIFISCLGCLLGTSYGHSSDLDQPSEVAHLAVASNFTPTMKNLVKVFEKSHRHKVRVSYGSSGKLYAQIKHGAPFHGLLSADQDKISRLVRDGLAHERDQFTYAIGTLVLWSSRENYVDSQGQILQSGNFQRLALANDKLAPYGLAAKQVLQHLQLIDTTQKKWITGENIAQTFQFVRSGNAQLGFIARSQLKPNTQGSYWLIPMDLYDPIKQDGILLKSASNNSAASAFMSFLTSATAQNIIHSFGYRLPQNNAKAYQL